MTNFGRTAVRTQGRIHRKRIKNNVPRNKKKPNYVLLFSLFFASVAIAGIVSYAFRTPALKIGEVRVAGAHLSNRSVVQRLADRAKGQNIILLGKSPILRSILKVSEVKNVKMGRCFPDGAWVRVWERKPDAVLTVGGRFCMVQMDGLMFHETRGPVRGVPLVIAAKCDKIKLGEHTCSQGVRYALEALTYARKEGLKLDKISVDPQGDMCLNMGSDFYIKLGQPDDMQRKMALLKNTLVYRPSIARKAVYVDLSCPSAPVWKPKLVAEAAS